MIAPCGVLAICGPVVAGCSGGTIVSAAPGGDIDAGGVDGSNGADGTVPCAVG